MKYCPDCGRPHPDNAIFCGICGVRFNKYSTDPFASQSAVQKEKEHKPFCYPLAWCIAAGAMVLLTVISFALN